MGEGRSAMGYWRWGRGKWFNAKSAKGGMLVRLGVGLGGIGEGGFCNHGEHGGHGGEGVVGGMLRGVKAGVVSAMMGRFSKVWKGEEGDFSRFGNWGAEEEGGIL